MAINKNKGLSFEDVAGIDEAREELSEMALNRIVFNLIKQ